PAVVVVEAGVNDLKAVAEFPERRDEIVNDCERNLDRMVERIRSMNAAVVLVGIFGIGDVALWRKPFWSDDVITVVGRVNAHLRSLASNGVFLLDPDPVLDDSRGRIKAEYQWDFLHLDEAGYAALNERGLVPLVRSLPR
ncbi:MAG: SGNH/GDSL hydrolase family protein, partial [Myxococcota bacterium]|nr:SGNH/GDSL hydrolase family protein [Myxococcota bacterium]